MLDSKQVKEMKNYVSTKMIKATPMNLVDAEEYLQRKIKEGNEEGYLVLYRDNYISWSPKAIFEESCFESGGISFGTAFDFVKRGRGMRLPHWKEDVVVRAQVPDDHSKMTAPYLYVESKSGRVPWVATSIELFAENWEVVD